MGDNEWVRLTPLPKGDPDGTVAEMKRCNLAPFTYALRVTYAGGIVPLTEEDGEQYFTNAELDALAAHAPAVKALVEAARRIEDGAHYRHMMGEHPVWACDYCGEEARDWWHIAHDVACPTHIAHLALAALDPATPEEDDG